jgi:putative transposase
MEHPTEAWTAADSRSVSVGRSAQVFDPPSRCKLRKRSHRSCESHGDKGSGHGGAIALAKSIRGAANRIHSPGVPGPRDCVERKVVAADPRTYFHYYGKSRTHLALGKDAPEPRAVHKPENGLIVEIPEVGELHHRYERRAA